MKMTEEELGSIAAQPVDRPRKLFVGKGVYLYMSPTGLRTWRLKLRKSRREQIRSLGRYPRMGMAEALAFGQEIKEADNVDAILEAKFLAQSAGAYDDGIKRFKELLAPQGMWVYFIGSEELDMVKIGVSRTPEIRLSDLQTGNPFELTLLAITPGGTKHERLLHQIFAREHHRGEWFKWSLRLSRFVASLC